MPVVLWTDALIYLLVSAAIGFVIYVRRHEHLRAPWRQVLKSRLGMSAAVILFAYVLIGLLDSIHFHPRLDGADGDGRYSADILSVFDVLMTPMRTRVEKTYSAPFATHLYAKESIELPGGKQIRDYRRLVYGGSHLTDLSRRGRDIALTVLRAVLEGIAVSALLLVVLVVVLARRAGVSFGGKLTMVVRGREPVPWNVLFGTACVLIVLGSFSIILRHTLPNVMHIVLITVVLDFSGLVLAEAVLSYVNIGVDPSTTSWGNMINSARLEMAREPIVWWSLAAAFVFMFTLVLSANLFSDAVRDAFDPRIRRG